MLGLSTYGSDPVAHDIDGLVSNPEVEAAVAVKEGSSFFVDLFTGMEELQGSVDTARSALEVGPLHDPLINRYIGSDGPIKIENQAVDAVAKFCG